MEKREKLDGRPLLSRRFDGIAGRTATGAGILGLTALFLLFSHIPWVPEAVTAILSMTAVFEILRAAHLLQERWLTAASMAGAAAVSLLPFPGYGICLEFLFPLAAIVFGHIMRRVDRCVLDTPGRTLGICAIVTLLLRAIPEVRALEHGLSYLTVAMLLCYATDAAAYLVGKALGRHKLCPRLSPNKTLEGCIGGILGAVLASLLIPQADRLMLLLYAVTASVVGQFGDLAMSGVKRAYGVKDFGRILPGHGGILDRFDSHLFTVAYTLLFCTVTRGYL